MVKQVKLWGFKTRNLHISHFGYSFVGYKFIYVLQYLLYNKKLPFLRAFLIFKQSLENMSLEELKEVKADLDDQVTKMILNSDLMLKIAIVTSQIDEKMK